MISRNVVRQSLKTLAPGLFLLFCFSIGEFDAALTVVSTEASGRLQGRPLASVIRRHYNPPRSRWPESDKIVTSWPTF